MLLFSLDPECRLAPALAAALDETLARHEDRRFEDGEHKLRPLVDPRGDMHFPVHNKDTGALEKPLIEARKTFYRDIALLALPASGAVAPDQVVNLTGQLGADGRLTWTAPAGKWEIVRVGYRTMGSMTQPGLVGARSIRVAVPPGR